MKHRIHFLLAVALFAWGSPVHGDGLSGSGDVALLNVSPIVQSFDSLASTGTGSSTGGNAYSFGAAASTERAVGSLGSGSVTAAFYGAKLTNLGSGPITALAISFDGEMWRRGGATTNGDRLTFSYSTTASDLTTGAYANVPALDFASPGNACLNGTGATNGSDTAGSDDGLAMDNVSMAATFSSDPTPPYSSAAVSPNPGSPGQQVALSGTIFPGFNPLSQTYTVTCNLTAIGGSSDQILPNDGLTFAYTAEVALDAPLGASPLPCSIEDNEGRSTAFSVALTVLLPLSENCNALATPVSAIQGPGSLSPLTGYTVDVEAVVVGDFQGSTGLSGFYIQEPAGEQDSSPLTSEGLFIFSPAPVNTGDRVRVRGAVAEFASSTGPATSRLTEVDAGFNVQVCSSNEALPVPVDVTLPVGESSEFERYEGMQVRFSQKLVVTGHFGLGQFGQIDLAPSVLVQPTHSIGNTVSWSAAADLIKRSRIALDDGSTQSNTNVNGGTVAPYPSPGLSHSNTLRVGARVNPIGDGPPTPLVGIMDDRFGAYRVHPTSAVTFSNITNPRPDTAAVADAAGARFRIVNANVLNFFTTLGSRGAATVTELDNQRTKLVAQLGRAGGDVIGLSELQNFANGQTNGGTYTNTAIDDLTSALALATGRNYHYLDTINAGNLAQGTVAGDNGTDAIRNGIIYDAGTVVPVGPAALYYQNDQNRPSLAQTFRPAAGVLADQQTFTVVVNHFRSKGSACGPLSDDAFQGNCNGMRVSMAANVSNWLAANPTSDPAGAKRRYILIGDFNAYFGEDPIQMLLGSGGYTNLINRLLGERAYSYNFGSQVGYLDHALVNAAALPLVKSIAELHINADEPPALQALDSNIKSAAARVAYYAGDEFAASDHDPIVIGFNPLLGDFDDDGDLDAHDRTALLAARDPGNSGHSGNGPADRRMDMDQDGEITQSDVHVWQNVFIKWKQGKK